MTPDEVRMLDNRNALLFIRGERPVQDPKYDILRHPNIAFTTDGGAEAYLHGEDFFSVAAISIVSTDKEEKPPEGIQKHDFLIFTEEEMQEMINKKMEELKNAKEQQQ